MSSDKSIGRRFFGTSRDKVLSALDVMGKATCAYGSWPDGRCDCKYGVKTIPTLSEQNGCPELRALYAVIGAMTDDEWTLIQQRADLAERLLRADAAASMAQSNIAAIRSELTGDSDAKSEKEQR